MKILLWTTNYYPYIGGIERLVHNLAGELIRQGHEVLVLTDAPKKTHGLEDSIDGVRIIRLPFSHALLNKQLALIKETMQSVIDVISTFRADLVHIHGWYETFAFYQVRIAEKLSLPFFLTVHGLLEQVHYRTLACQRLLTLCQSVSVVSNSLRHALHEEGVTHKDLRLIYNGSPISIEPVKSLTGPVNKLVCVGRLSPEKGFETALHALKLLQPAHPTLQLTIAGGGPLYAVLAELINELGLNSQVNLLDYVPPPDVDTLIDQNDVVLMPSTYESFGLVALEASLRGRPVIAGCVDGLKEVVLHGETGLLVPPEDPVALAEALRQLIDNPDLVAEMGKHGHQRGVNCFSLELMTTNYLTMYRGENGNASSQC